MLFDLQSGKRRRVVQVVYSFLAASFLIGFVIFGVGSGGIGSISDIFGGGSSSSGAVASQFNDQIDAAQAKVAKNPKDPQALAQLAKYEFYKGRAETTADQSTGQIVVSDAAHADLGAAVDAWERYLDVAKQPDVGTAQLLVQAYATLNDAAGAARTQQIVVDAKPSYGGYGNLAIYLYFAGKIDAGDTAAAKAVNEAPASQRKTTKQRLDQIRQQAVKQAKAQKQAGQAGAAGSAPNPLANPLSGLGGSTSTP